MDPITQQAVLATAGAAAGGDKVYVDDVFSTFLTLGAGGQTITNGIDLATEGGMVWSKGRDVGIPPVTHDTERGVNKFLQTIGSDAEIDLNGNVHGGSITAFNNNGFTTGSDGAWGYTDLNGYGNYVHWTFRKAPGFFDVVTYTGNGSTQNISHSLGSVPGMIIVKATSSAGDWYVYHRSIGASKTSKLNSNEAFYSYTSPPTFPWNNTTPTSTVFSVNANASFSANTSGVTYVAYVFAHDEPVFGTNEDESIIKCGSYTGNGSTTGPVINLGFEPQWLMVKRSDNNTPGFANYHSWAIQDNMRGLNAPPNASSSGFKNVLWANQNNAEATRGNGGTAYAEHQFLVTSTGFTVETSATEFNHSSGTYIYMAIRRPNKPPEVGTDVFKATLQSSENPFNVGFPTDMAISAYTGGGGNKYLLTRLTNAYLLTDGNVPESTIAQQYFLFDLQNSYQYGGWLGYTEVISYNFKRAPGFFDVVTYSGTSSARNQEHNLGVAPELVIVKARSGTYNQNWVTGPFTPGYSNGYLYLNTDMGPGGNQSNYLPSVSSSTISLTAENDVNGSAYIFVAYLFATLPGISKVGSYTGTGNNIDINCGFTAGARFVMIKRTDAAGSWFVFDSVRGIVSGNDPFLNLDTNSAQGTGDDEIDPLSTGFTVASTASNDINASGGKYLFLAIA